MKLLFLVNDAGFFLSHRLPIALAARAQGYEVHVATPPHTGEERIQALGFPFYAIPLTRPKGRLRQELCAFVAICRLYRRLRPDLVHHVTIKPVLYGSLAARLTGVPAVVNAVSGLGYLFTRQGRMSGSLGLMVRQLLRLAFGHRNSRVIFQNPDDQRELINLHLLQPAQTLLIKGAGVDLAQFSPVSEPPCPPVVMLASRMLWDKGVGEFVAAAAHLKAQGVAARFVLVGAPDPGNPTSVCLQQMEQWQSQGVVEWWGARSDMPATLAQAHVVCLPSYREGLPKVLIEAAASGRPIVATDVPGCREIARHFCNALLVPVASVEPLAAALKALIEDPQLRHELGVRGRELAVAEFSVEGVAEKVLAVYQALRQEA